MKIKKNVDLSKYSTFKIGGKASLFVEVSSINDLKKAISFSKKNKLKVFILGGGSNILFSDATLKFFVIKININGIEFHKNNVLVGAGENWDEFVKKTLNKKLYGLENLSGIPGTVGATPIQNVGAYGVEVSKFIKEVHTINKKNLKEKIFSDKECQFDYRDSFFKTKRGKNFIITRVLFSLNKKFKPNITYKDLNQCFTGKKKPGADEVRKAVIKIRSRKFPDLKTHGTAGSFFKNPIISKTHYNSLLKKYHDLPGFETEKGRIKIPLAFILDKILGLTGFRVGPVGLYKKQPLVIVNYNKAKPPHLSFRHSSAVSTLSKQRNERCGGKQKDILKLQKIIEKKVFDKTKIKINPEVTLVK